MRQRCTKVGASCCEMLKNAALPRQALVMLVAPANVAAGTSPAAVAVKGAVGLAGEQTAPGHITLAETRDVAVGAALDIVEDRVGIRGGEIHRHERLDLAPGARHPGVEVYLRLLTREIPMRAARMG